MDAAVNKQLESKQSKKHPPGLYLLFMTEMWERFSYYGMRAILVLYLTKSLVNGGLGMNESTALALYGFFTGAVYFTPLIGGWLSDRFLGQRRAVYYRWNHHGNRKYCSFCPSKLWSSIHRINFINRR